MRTLFHSSTKTKREKLLEILADGEWHSTQELSRRVGHTFAIFKAKLVNNGYPIERRRHETRRYQHEYRLTDTP